MGWEGRPFIVKSGVKTCCLLTDFGRWMARNLLQSQWVTNGRRFYLKDCLLEVIVKVNCLGCVCCGMVHFLANHAAFLVQNFAEMYESKNERGNSGHQNGTNAQSQSAQWNLAYHSGCFSSDWDILYKSLLISWRHQQTFQLKGESMCISSISKPHFLIAWW